MVKGARVKCPYEGCEKDYLNRCNLKRHINLHHLNRMFVCPICLKSLSSRQNKDEHMNGHTGEKPYKCQVPGCLEAFRQASQLSLHRRIHRMIHELSYQECPSWNHPLESTTTDLLTVPYINLPTPRGLNS